MRSTGGSYGVQPLEYHVVSKCPIKYPITEGVKVPLLTLDRTRHWRCNMAGLPIRIKCAECGKYAGIDREHYNEPDRDQFGVVWTSYDQYCDECREKKENLRANTNDNNK